MPVCTLVARLNSCLVWLVLFITFLWLTGNYYKSIYKTNPSADPIFIYKSLLYKNSTTFGGKSRYDAVAMLANIDNYYYLKANLRVKAFCMVFPQFGIPYLRRAEIMVLVENDRAPGCDLSTYRFVCRSLRIHPTDTVMLKIGSSPPAPIALKPADTTKRNIVMCTSRMFAFEAWKPLIFSLELYRALGVDLVVAHVESVIASIFEVMKHYEADGILKIRASLRMPHTELMDPNAETERGNHLAIYQECLYEFRESAEFIAFVDWDDFFVPLRQSTLIAAFRRQARLYPNAGAYRVSRRHTMFLSNGGPFNMRRTLNLLGLAPGASYTAVKMFVNPRKVISVWIHNPLLMEGKYKHVRVRDEEILLFHSRDNKTSRGNKPLSKLLIVAPKMINNYETFVSRRNLSELLSRLPQKHTYYEHFSKCYKEFGGIRRLDDCFTPRFCHKPSGWAVDLKCYGVGVSTSVDSCTNVRNQFGAYRSRANHIYVREDATYVECSTCDVWAEVRRR